MRWIANNQSGLLHFYFNTVGVIIPFTSEDTKQP